MNPRIITAANVNTALLDGLYWLSVAGTIMPSRNGPALVAPGPVLTVYRNPQERVLFSPLRDANPFFHLYECIWMLAGRNDSASVGNYARTMEMFADDGILHGAYGYRWRSYFGFDQLREIIELLRADRHTRRAVLQMWAPWGDLVDSIDDPAQGGATGSKDVPCNTAVYFDASHGVLNMTVTNRSNDIVWGAYGANAVHMSFLQEVIAAELGIPVGQYCQFSNNFHTYIDRPDVARLIQGKPGGGFNVSYTADDRYHGGKVTHYPVNQFGFHYKSFISECEYVAESPCDANPQNAFLRHVVQPIMRAHREYQYGDYAGARYAAHQCWAMDWRFAAVEWIDRREQKAKNVHSA